MANVSIINYGIGNILSVRRAFEKEGVDTKLVSTPEDILNSERIVLPGVGAFRDGMEELRNRGLVEAIWQYCKEDKPFLGICLGMQMMLEESEEFGFNKGIGIIRGKVVQIENITTEGACQKVPHIGWNKLYYPNCVSDTLLQNIPEESSMYFVHSYTAKPDLEENRLADTYYGGHRLSAVIQKGKCYGMQFHPEKSGILGLKMIHNFLEL